MTVAAGDVLRAFEALSPSDQRDVAAEILRREAGKGTISDEALDELAADLLRGYDAEEAARADA